MVPDVYVFGVFGGHKVSRPVDTGFVILAKYYRPTYSNAHFVQTGTHPYDGVTCVSDCHIRLLWTIDLVL